MAALNPRSARRLLAAALCSPWLPVLLAQDRIAQFLAEFNRESDPVRKAKVLPKLGDAQFALMHKALDAGEYSRALQILEQYRDQAKSVEAALKASGLDAERKPAGFKQLQIHVRKSVRELDQFVLGLPEDQREPFQAIRRELATVEKELFDMLFPRQPGKSPPKQKPKG